MVLKKSLTDKVVKRAFKLLEEQQQIANANKVTVKDALVKIANRSFTITIMDKKGKLDVDEERRKMQEKEEKKREQYRRLSPEGKQKVEEEKRKKEVAKQKRQEERKRKASGSKERKASISKERKSPSVDKSTPEGKNKALEQFVDELK